MKKHDEGYILAYVLVILTVVCLIAVSALTVPMTNLRAQKEAVARMQQQYAAQGLIEQALTKVRNDMESIQMVVNTVYLEDAQKGVEKHDTKGILSVSAEERAWEITQVPGEGLYVTSPVTWYEKEDESGKRYDCAFSLTAVSGSEMITVGVTLQDVIVGTRIETPQIVPFSYSSCAFAAPVTDGQEGGGVNAP